MKIREAQSEASAGASDWKKEAAEMEKRAAEKAKETAALAAMKERKRADKASAEQDAAAAEQAAALAEAGEVAEAMAAEAKAKAEEEAAEKQAVLEAELEAQKAAAEEAAAAAAAAARTGGWGAQAVTSLITQIIALRSHLQEQLEAHLMMDSEPVEEGGQEAEAEHRDWLVEQHTLAVGAEAQMAKAEGELANHLNGTEENQVSAVGHTQYFTATDGVHGCCYNMLWMAIHVVCHQKRLQVTVFACSRSSLATRTLPRSVAC